MTNPTLKKIAQTLGLSISTVSRALKQHPDISAITRNKVTELAKSLDYEPNANAVHLRTQNSKLFGVLVPTISNYFYDSFIASIEEEGRKTGYSVMILQSGNDPVIEMDNLKLFRQNRISGLFACITSKTTDLAGFGKLEEMDVPIIFFDIVPQADTINKVCLADHLAGQMAAEAIIRRKKKYVYALFGDQTMSISKQRKKAFTETIQKKAPTISLQTDQATSSEQARELTNKILAKKKRPDTIFCMSDQILIGVMKALQQNHIGIPEQMAVITISNGFIPKLFHPDITYVETSGHKLGKLAFSRMMQWLEGDHEYGEIILESVLVEGGSL